MKIFSNIPLPPMRPPTIWKLLARPGYKYYKYHVVYMGEGHVVGSVDMGTDTKIDSVAMIIQVEDYIREREQLEGGIVLLNWTRLKKIRMRRRRNKDV